VDQLVIVDSPGTTFGEQDEAAMARRLGAERVEEIFLPDSPEDVQRILDLTFFKDHKLPRGVLDTLLVSVFSANEAQHRELLADLRQRRQGTALPDFSRHPPPLVVWGEHDEVFPVAKGKELAAALGGTLVVIPKTAHGPNIEDPKRFNAAVLAYLGP
jgi:pimeloyl-ACP methyl ester carboxylesterase